MSEYMTNIPRPSSADTSQGGVRLLLQGIDFVGNMWFGVTVMTLILVYCWVGSAGTYPFEWFPRQTFEKTEMEWFTWWPFLTLVGLLCLSLSCATLRKIPFNLPNLGTWSAHLGILVLVLGCGIYYSQKLEGDIAVYRRQAIVQVEDGEPASLVLRPGEQVVVRGSSRAYRVRVATLNPAYELLTGDDKGKKTYAAQLDFAPLGGTVSASFASFWWAIPSTPRTWFRAGGGRSRHWAGNWWTSPSRHDSNMPPPICSPCTIDPRFTPAWPVGRSGSSTRSRACLATTSSWPPPATRWLRTGSPCREPAASPSTCGPRTIAPRE
ncbi:MAG: hypothetical protein Q9Q13_11185 [Acidobacteriota bacterium]|nr:hypothetical protein [Acidobacteriota bacterium]